MNSFVKLYPPHQRTDMTASESVELSNTILADGGLEQAGREIMWNVSSLPNVVTMYALFAISMLVFAWGIWSRVRLWSSGQPAPERLGDWAKRFGLLFRYGLGQKKVNRKPNVRRFHTLIFWGFLVSAVYDHHGLYRSRSRGRDLQRKILSRRDGPQ